MRLRALCRLLHIWSRFGFSTCRFTELFVPAATLVIYALPSAEGASFSLTEGRRSTTLSQPQKTGFSMLHISWLGLKFRLRCLSQRSGSGPGIRVRQLRDGKGLQVWLHPVGVWTGFWCEYGPVT
jgi:hypothetical protein